MHGLVIVNDGFVPSQPLNYSDYFLCLKINERSWIPVNLSQTRLVRYTIDVQSNLELAGPDWKLGRKRTSEIWEAVLYLPYGQNRLAFEERFSLLRL